MRIIITSAALLAILFAPWWVPALLMLALALRYPAWEVPFIGLVADLLWLPLGDGFSFPLFTMFGVAVVWLASPMRRQLLL